MALWKVTLAYDGTGFSGWQVQPGLATVQGTLADALCRIAGERVLPQGSGRTDAGVHALGQVATFALDAAIPPENLLRALNRTLPGSIRILAADHAPAGFHARHSAIRKTYEYRIFPLKPAAICSPFLAPYVWPCPWPLDLGTLNQAAAEVVGTHDFTSFAASDPDQTIRGTSEPLPPPIRTIFESSWRADPYSGIVFYTVTGSGFLHHMVRNLVGTFVQAGANRLDPHALPAILAARNRSAAGPTAPASGLFLVGVTY